MGCSLLSLLCSLQTAGRTATPASSVINSLMHNDPSLSCNLLELVPVCMEELTRRKACSEKTAFHKNITYIRHIHVSPAIQIDAQL